MEKDPQKIDWGALPKGLQATLTEVVSKELFERLDEEESGHIPFFTEEERDTKLIANMELAILPYLAPQEKQEIPDPTKSHDELFAAVLLKDIPYFHELFARYHDPEALETAKNLSVAYEKLKKRGKKASV